MNYFMNLLTLVEEFIIQYFSILLFEKTNLIELIFLVCDCVLVILDIEVKRLSLQWKQMFSFVEICWYYWK